jgi:hypothetical protein
MGNGCSRSDFLSNRIIFTKSFNDRLELQQNEDESSDSDEDSANKKNQKYIAKMGQMKDGNFVIEIQRQESAIVEKKKGIVVTTENQSTNPELMKVSTMRLIQQEIKFPSTNVNACNNKSDVQIDLDSMSSFAPTPVAVPTKLSHLSPIKKIMKSNKHMSSKKIQARITNILPVGSPVLSQSEEHKGGNKFILNKKIQL